MNPLRRLWLRFKWSRRPVKGLREIARDNRQRELRDTISRAFPMEAVRVQLAEEVVHQVGIMGMMTSGKPMRWAGGNKIERRVS